MRLALTCLLAACRQDDGVSGYDAFAKHVQRNRIGSNADQWIEMHNAFGQWERTGLIFGYTDDYGECLKAIEGLKKANFNREYRCTSAN